jgi:small-conductance mechanosensitive channel
VVHVRNLGDNGIELELTAWIRDAELGQNSLRSEILLNAWRSFRENNIEVPFPQREVRMLADTANIPQSSGTNPNDQSAPEPKSSG